MTVIETAMVVNLHRPVFERMTDCVAIFSCLHRLIASDIDWRPSAAAGSSKALGIRLYRPPEPAGTIGALGNRRLPYDRVVTHGPEAPFEIRRARPDEVEALRSLIAESMGHWDRSPAYLAEAISLMSLNADDVARDEAFVLVVGAEIAAFCRVSVTARSAEIEELHVRPHWIGHGYGRALFEHAALRAAQRRATVLRWSTDQHAAGFYEHMGGRSIGFEPSGIAGDDPLILMELRIADRAGAKSESGKL
jgi:GNAT superfamily N-acetyltransferase